MLNLKRNLCKSVTKTSKI